jgi:hypothetical protein
MEFITVQPDRFFSTDSPKAIKADAYGYVNAINYMAPASTAGIGNLCPHASPGCLALCLGWYSGQAGMLNNAELETGRNAARNSRARKARMFMQDRQAFMLCMANGIRSCLRRAKRLRKRLCVRHNGATDISWEAVKMEGPFGRFTIIDMFSEVQFVDYTKNFKRMMRFCNHMLPKNYHLTFSRSETNESECLEVLKAGGNVAVVFAGAMPSEYLGYTVVNGDNHDLRHLDPKGGVIIGLSPKGRKAKNDLSGFVVRCPA